MPSLLHCLQNKDLGLLRNINELWGFDLDESDAKKLSKLLARSMPDKQVFQEIFESLPRNSQNGLLFLMSHQGIVSKNLFEKKFGNLRAMGVIQRDREKPHQNPISSTEILWYRGFIGQDFLEIDGVLQECFYIPLEFQKLLPITRVMDSRQKLPQQIPDSAIKSIQNADDHILDMICTLLSSLRNPGHKQNSEKNYKNPELTQLLTLCKKLGLINEDETVCVERAKPHLEAERPISFINLVKNWISNENFNELRLVPSLICEGTWDNTPSKARLAVIETIRDIPAGQWFDIDAFVDLVYESHADFMRSGGEYDTWLIRSNGSSGLLTGFNNWFEVEGEYLRFLITGPFHWFGLVDLAKHKFHASYTAFRISSMFHEIINCRSPQAIKSENAPIIISSSGVIEMTTHTPRIARYQISRFCEWISRKDNYYRYRLTPNSLTAAEEQGLKPTHLITLLRKYGQSTPPPALMKAIRRWSLKGREAFVEHLLVLKVNSPEMLVEIRNSPIQKYLGEPLNAVSIVVKPGMQEKVRAALARSGYLSDIEE